MWERRLTAPSFRVTKLQGEGLPALLLCSMAFALLELRLTPVLPDWKLNYQCSQGWTGPGKLVLINQTQKTLIPSLVGCFSTMDIWLVTFTAQNQANGIKSTLRILHGQALWTMPRACSVTPFLLQEVILKTTTGAHSKRGTLLLGKYLDQHC